MELVLRYTGRKRLIVSLPFAAGKAQGFVLEKLPVSILTITQDQVSITLPKSQTCLLPAHEMDSACHGTLNGLGRTTEIRQRCERRCLLRSLSSGRWYCPN